jgi:hypothetical protein
MREAFDWRLNAPPGLTPQGIRFNDELAGPNGVAIELLPAPHHTNADLVAARNWLRNQRDVVRWSAHHDHEWSWAAWYAGRGLDPAEVLRELSPTTTRAIP